MSGFLAINAVVIALSLIQGAGLVAYLLLGSTPGEARAQAAEAPQPAAQATSASTPAADSADTAEGASNPPPVACLETAWGWAQPPCATPPPRASKATPASRGVLPCGLRAPPHFA